MCGTYSTSMDALRPAYTAGHESFAPRSCKQLGISALSTCCRAPGSTSCPTTSSWRCCLRPRTRWQCSHSCTSALRQSSELNSLSCGHAEPGTGLLQQPGWCCTPCLGGGSYICNLHAHTCRELVFEADGTISGMVSLEGERVSFVESVNPAATGACEAAWRFKASVTMGAHPSTSCCACCLVGAVYLFVTHMLIAARSELHWTAAV